MIFPLYIKTPCNLHDKRIYADFLGADVLFEAHCLQGLIFWANALSFPSDRTVVYSRSPSRLQLGPCFSIKSQGGYK